LSKGSDLFFRIITTVFFLFLVFACEKEGPSRQTDDFNILMGLNKNVWKFVETEEDFKNIEIFKNLYDKNKHLQFIQKNEVKIPKVIHFIWLGPSPFPKESLENVSSFVNAHPDWVFKFWTDRRRPLPHPQMDLKLVDDFNFIKLENCFHASDNYGEKSDILRYEILFQEGGLYIDHDVQCFKSFEPFHHHFDLYCGVEPPHSRILSSSISVCNNIIGVRPNHPAIEFCLDHVDNEWDAIALAYPGSDKDSTVYRVAQRTFAAFDNAIKSIGHEQSSRDIVFPAAYFNRIDNDFALFAHHDYASTWFEDETKFERNVRRRLVSISKKNNQILLFNAIILTVNLALFMALFIHYRMTCKKIRMSKVSNDIDS